MLSMLLLIAAIVLGIIGVVTIVKGDVVIGLVLIVLAVLIGPTGYGIYRP